MNNQISKGGLIGALIGAIASVFIHRSGESTVRSATKTGLFSALGYFIGSFTEKKISQRKSNFR